MTKTIPGLLNQQPQNIRDKIVEMAKTQHISGIVEWLQEQGIPATWNQVRYFIQTNGIRTRLQPITPVKGHAAKVRVYLGALLKYNEPTYTIGNIRLHGASWSQVSCRLHIDGMIEPMRKYSPKRWRIIASKAELEAWMKKELKE